MDGTKRFRHAVDSNGNRATCMSMFDVSIVEPLEVQCGRSLHSIASIKASDYLHIRVARLRTLR